MISGRPFWERKTLAQMNRDEWESLCDGCGRCCLIKFEDEETGELAVTGVACRLLDMDTCRCTRYRDRHDLVDDCVRIDADAPRRLAWMPQSCAYRRIAEGRGLAWWHPLVSGDPQTVVDAGIGIRDWALSERDVHPDEIFHIQPLRWVGQGGP